VALAQQHLSPKKAEAQKVSSTPPKARGKVVVKRRTTKRKG